MNRRLLILFTLWLGLAAIGHAQLQPLVSNVQASQRTGTKLVDISYSVAYGGGPVTIWIDVSNDSGRSFIVPAKTFSGHIGQNVQPGNNRTVVWNAEADFDGMLAEQMRVRVNARGGNVPVPPPNMVYIPGGHFYMGAWTDGNAASARSVYISPFFMDRYEVWGTLYGSVREWAINHNYNMSAGGANSGNHPIRNINWYDAIKWCNARSEMESLTPVYYTDASQTDVYRSGNVDMTNVMVKWNADGYRLPTESEWEKSARGGLSGKVYPWGDVIDHQMANYQGSSHPWTSHYAYSTTPIGYYNGNQQGGGNDMANGYGIYDVTGNVWEWCWDREGTPTGNDNPMGSDNGTSRIMRGGSFFIGNQYQYNGPAGWQCHERRIQGPGSVGTPFDNWATPAGDFGFRCARGL